MLDTLSRNGARDGSVPDDLGLDVYVDAILKQMPVSDEKLEQIRNASKDDSELQELQKHVQQGWPDSPKGVPAMIPPYTTVVLSGIFVSPVIGTNFSE